MSRLGYALAAALLAGSMTPVLAQDVQKCFAAAEKVKDGKVLAESEKSAAHGACLRAFSDSSSVVQKYHLQEADFDIMGTRPPKP
jgi:hypothetical protein